MSKTFIFSFCLSVVLLIVSEYFFLDELLYNRRPWYMALSLAGIFLSIFFIVRFYRQWRSMLK